MDKRQELWTALYRDSDTRATNLVKEYNNTFSSSNQLPFFPIEKPLQLKSSKFNYTNNSDQYNLLPVRIDVESDNAKLRDTLLINVADKDIEAVAATTCQDLKITEIQHLIVKAIEDQVVDGVSRPMEVLPDTRINIQLDLTIGQTSLVDQFEWDLSNPDEYAEIFAELMTKELQLAPEFKIAISHAIREQSETYHRTLMDQEKSIQLLPVVVETKRKDPIGPFLSYLDAEQLDKLERDTDRQIRRKRRQTARSRRNNVDNEFKTIWSHYENTSLVPAQPVYGAPVHGGVAHELGLHGNFNAVQGGPVSLAQQPQASVVDEQELYRPYQHHMNNLKQKYSHSKFYFTLRRVTNEVKVVCEDCFSKQYSIGPGNTLENFETHLKNRQHQMNMSNRIARELDQQLGPEDEDLE